MTKHLDRHCYTVTAVAEHVAVVVAAGTVEDIDRYGMVVDSSSPPEANLFMRPQHFASPG